MSRPASGSVTREGTRWRVKLTLNGQVWRGTVPKRTDRREITEAYANLYKDKLLERWRLGIWNPFEQPETTTSATTVIDYCTAFVDKQEYENKLDDQRKLKRYISRHPIAHIPLADVKPRDVARFIEYLQKLPSKRGGTLAPRSVRNIYSILQRAFARAVVDEVWPISPCEAIAKAGMLPKVQDKNPIERSGWKYTRTQVRQLTTDLRVPSDRRVFYALLFCTGARVGEIAALRWSDYDKTAQPLGKITINKAFKSKKRVVGATKTLAVKEVPVHPYLARILEDWFNVGYEDFLKEPPSPDSLLIPNRRGKPRHTGPSHARFLQDLSGLGITHKGMLVHSTRHTFISLARSDGAKRDLLKWVTHAPPRTDAQDGYTSPEWEALCNEVARFRLDPGLDPPAK